MNMTDEEFERIYGRKPYKKQKKVKIYWGRIIAAAVILILVIYLIVKAITGVYSLIKGDKNDTSDSKAKTASAAAAGTKAKKNKEDVSEEEPSITVAEGSITVCIDAGHGDYDGGTTDSTGTRFEKTDNLKIALEVQKKLEAMGVNVVMTRDDDTFVDLGDRCEIANDAKADLFVSLHRNSYDGDISGVEIWVNNAEPEYDTMLGQNIMDKLASVGITDNRGVQYGYVGNPGVNYYINADTVMPSCLVELGFLTVEEDNRLFDEHLEDYGRAIAEGIVKTAYDIGLVDSDGNRAISEQLLSAEKYINRAEDDSQEPTPAGSFETDTDGEVYNTQENEYY